MWQSYNVGLLWNMIMIRWVFIFLLICSPAYSATEELVPTSTQLNTWDTGSHLDIDDGSSPDDGTVMSTDKAGELTLTGGFSDLVTADSNDTYNSVTVYLRSDMTGTANDETVTLDFSDGTDTVQVSGNNSTPADDSADGTTEFANFTDLNALTWVLTAVKSGPESVTLWRAQNVYVLVDYTAVAASAYSHHGVIIGGE